MSRERPPPRNQDLFAAFEEAAREERLAHLPATIGEAVPYFQHLLERLHAAILAGDAAEAERLKGEALDLAVHLNGSNFGILAHENSPARVLEREAAAPRGVKPLWGQRGDVNLSVRGVPVLAHFSGVFGVGFPAFSAHALDPDQPFISETGYRSFLQGHLGSALGQLPDEFARACIEAHVTGELRGRLKSIAPEYRPGLRADALSPVADDRSILAGPPEDPPESTGGPHPAPAGGAVLPVEPTGDSAPEAGPSLSHEFNRERTPMRGRAPPDTATIAKLVSSLAHRHSAWQVFADFCEMSAIALSNAVDVRQRQAREARYFEVIRRYEQAELEKFPHMLGALTLALEEEPGDVLGHTFHELELHNKWAGQFFSPYPLCRMMAAMSVGDGATLREKISGRGYLTASEPACGSGALVIALAHAIKDLGINYQQHLHVSAVDVDLKCVHMTYLQLSLLHVPAIITHGNSLTLESWSQWYTPAHILGGWDARLTRTDASGAHEIHDAPVPDATADTPAPEPAPMPGPQLKLF